jgi:hypothetical protein
MKKYEKPRHAASNAVAALRKAVGKIQTNFAVEDLKVAVSTLARYETSTPPRGDVLLQLAAIADREASSRSGVEQHQFVELRETFRFLFLADVRKTLGFDLVVYHATKDQPAHGVALTGLEGPEELRAAHSFISLLSMSRSRDPAFRKIALAEFDSMGKAAEKRHGNDPVVGKVHDAVFGPLPKRQR